MSDHPQGPSSPDPVDPAAVEWDDVIEQLERDRLAADPDWLPKDEVVGEPAPEPDPPEPAVDSPPQVVVPPPVEPAWTAPDTRVRRRVAEGRADPLFMYAVLLALSVGLTPLAVGSPNERYAILWTLLTGAGIAGMLLNERANIGILRYGDLIWGGAMGLVLGLPLLLIGTSMLSSISERIFIGMPDGAVFQSVVFVMSLSESLFFRGVVQAEQPLLTTALMSGAWSMLLFLPTMDVGGYPMVALVAATFIAMLSVLYSYVRQRSGLAAALLCQIIVSVLWLFLPRLFVG